MSLTGCAFNLLKYSYRSMKGSPPAFILLPLRVHIDLRRKIFFVFFMVLAFICLENFKKLRSEIEGD